MRVGAGMRDPAPMSLFVRTRADNDPRPASILLWHDSMTSDFSDSPLPDARDHRAAFSFSVPAHDEARLIGATLQCLHDAARSLRLAYEIVVVDDASSDDTAAIARSLGARVLRVEHRHIAATRNAGARVALGER